MSSSLAAASSAARPRTSSPRGSLALYRLAQASALLDGRDYALPDDIKDLVYPALGHRVILSSPARIRGKTTREVVDELLERIPVPGAMPGSRSSRLWSCLRRGR